jgi:hypothetical protein
MVPHDLIEHRRGGIARRIRPRGQGHGPHTGERCARNEAGVSRRFSRDDSGDEAKTAHRGPRHLRNPRVPEASCRSCSSARTRDILPRASQLGRERHIRPVKGTMSLVTANRDGPGTSRRVRTQPRRTSRWRRAPPSSTAAHVSPLATAASATAATRGTLFLVRVALGVATGRRGHARTQRCGIGQPSAQLLPRQQPQFPHPRPGLRLLCGILAATSMPRQPASASS